MAKYNRESILQAGITLMQSGGYAGTGVNDILKEAEVPKGSFYNFFESKEDFVVQAVKFYGKGFQEMMTRLLEEGAGGPLDQMRHFFRALARCSCEQGNVCFLTAVRNELLGVSVPAIEAIHEEQDAHAAILAKWIRAGQDGGEIRTEIEPMGMAYYLISSFSGVACGQRGRSDLGLLEIFDRLVFEDLLVE